MRIQVNQDAVCKNIPIPKGEYWVTLNPASGQITLMAGGHDIQIPAMRRRSQTKAKTTQVQFYCGGGNSWSLVITTPKQGEWIAMIEYSGGKP